MAPETIQAAFQEALGPEYQCSGATLTRKETLTGAHEVFQMLYAHDGKHKYISCILSGWDGDTIKRWVPDAVKQIHTGERYAATMPPR